MVEPPLQVVEGTRAGSSLYYDNDCYLYFKESTRNGSTMVSTYFRCRRKYCTARLVWRTGQQLCYSHKHNHSPEEEFLNDLKYRQKLRQRASVENIPLSTIYNQEQEVSPQLALSTRPYNGTVRKMMERARKKNLPKVPRSIQEIDNFIRDERYYTKMPKAKVLRF